MITGHYPTGRDTIDATKLQWLSVEPHVAQILSRARIKGLQPGQPRLDCWRAALFLAQKKICASTTPPTMNRPASPQNRIPQPLPMDTIATACKPPTPSRTIFASAQAPTWLDFDDQSGLIEGHTPDTTCIFTIVFEAVNGRGGHVAQNFRLQL